MGGDWAGHGILDPQNLWEIHGKSMEHRLFFFLSGYINYFHGHVQSQTVSLPEGIGFHDDETISYEYHKLMVYTLKFTPNIV